jgi:hypothetical protein
MNPSTEISWRMVVIVGLLVVAGMVASLLGDKVIGASLVSGALGYLAQGFGHTTNPPREDGAVIDTLHEISQKLTAPKPPGPARVTIGPLCAAVAMLYLVTLLGGR